MEETGQTETDPPPDALLLEDNRRAGFTKDSSRVAGLYYESPDLPKGRKSGEAGSAHEGTETSSDENYTFLLFQSILNRLDLSNPDPYSELVRSHRYGAGGDGTGRFYLSKAEGW